MRSTPSAWSPSVTLHLLPGHGLLVPNANPPTPVATVGRAAERALARDFFAKGTR
jgi:hypothetical protein